MQALHLFNNKDVIRNQSVFLVRSPEIGQPLATPRTVEIQVLERNACHVARESGSPHAVVMSGESISPDSGDQAFFNLVSPSAQPLERIIIEIAPTDIPVLIIGESGSGKEVIARRLHRLSHRGDEPFVRLTCARLSPKDLDQLLGGRKSAGHSKAIVRRRDSFPGRGLRLGPGLPAQAAPPSSGRRCRISRSLFAGAHHIVHQPKHRGTNPQWTLPGGALLPAQWRLPSSATSATSKGRHPGSCRFFPEEVREAIGAAQADFQHERRWAGSLITLGRETSGNWKMWYETLSRWATSDWHLADPELIERRSGLSRRGDPEILPEGGCPSGFAPGGT